MRNWVRSVAGLAVLVALGLPYGVLAGDQPVAGVGLSASQKIGKIHHVFVVMLENEGVDYTFGPGSPAPYFAGQLVHAGAMLKRYYAIGHFSLDNYIAIVSGQAPNPDTQADCMTYKDFAAAGTTPDGQAIGRGCVYPASVKTIADQLQAAGLTWKGYMEDMGNDPARENACGQPIGGLNAFDRTQKAERGDEYAARHNPFVYFHSLVDDPNCVHTIVNLSTLKADLGAVATTPNLVFITPNLCHDGHDEPCIGGEAPGGLASADEFLHQVVPMILGSPAYRQDGLLVITFDEAEADTGLGPKGLTLGNGDFSACCNEPRGPNLKPGDTVFGAPDLGPGIKGAGGGRIGAVVLSPYIAPETVSMKPYNHYGLLKTIETIFHLPTLGYAGASGIGVFGADVFGGRDKD